MAKNNQTQINQSVSVRITIIALVIAILTIVFNTNTANGTLFGYQLSKDYATDLLTIISGLGTLSLISLFFNRYKLTWKSLRELACIYLAIFMFLFGWKLASAGTGVENIQNDGNNVTGGFMMFASGLYFGYALTAVRFMANKKKGSKNGK